MVVHHHYGVESDNTLTTPLKAFPLNSALAWIAGILGTSIGFTGRPCVMFIEDQ